MSRLLDNTETPATNLDVCTFCGEEYARATLEWSGGRAACRDCRRQQEADESAMRASLARGRETERTATQSARALEVGIDRAFKLGGFTARWGTYGVGYYLATEYDVVSHMLHGLVMADLATWLCTAWIDIRSRRRQVIIELIGFAALTQVMLHTDLIAVPNQPADIGVAFLTFVTFFTIKGTIALTKRVHPDPD